MAYTKKTWVKGSTPLSAENFNHMEQGIADAHSSIAQLNSDMDNKDFYIISADIPIQYKTDWEIGSFDIDLFKDGYKFIAGSASTGWNNVDICKIISADVRDNKIAVVTEQKTLRGYDIKLSTKIYIY